VVLDIANGRVGLISVTYGFNGAEPDEPWQVNTTDDWRPPSITSGVATPFDPAQAQETNVPRDPQHGRAAPVDVRKSEAERGNCLSGSPVWVQTWTVLITRSVRGRRSIASVESSGRARGDA
jgi:hypothetical protein